MVMPALAQPIFERIAIIGYGLVGSSLGRAAREYNLAKIIVACDADANARQTIAENNLADFVTDDPAEAAANADLVVLATPLGAYGDIVRKIAPVLAEGAILSDVGSVKGPVVKDLRGLLPDHIHFVPGHPVAGTENSGPQSGFATMFDGRWCILTPPEGTDTNAIEKVADLWRGCGSLIEIMDAVHHDKVLAITSHLPHLIAYTIVGTAANLEEDAKSEVIKFSASGFRDFTRIAASDPTMWRDICLNNREAILEMLQRFTEDLTAMQRAIRFGEGEALFELFSRTRGIRRRVIDARQA